MKRSQRSKLKVKITTPGGKNKWVFKLKRTNHPTCGACGCKLNRGRYTKVQIKKLTKVQRRPTRPFPELCTKCMRIKIKGVMLK